MKVRLIATAALLSALPASGGSAPPSEAQIDALTPIDAQPSRALVDLAFPGDTVASLRALATDSTVDLGLQLRAMRMLPEYCPPIDCAGTDLHQTLVDIVTGYRARLTAGELPPRELLRLRAAMEALGATRSGDPADVALLVDARLLKHASRDVQVAAVHAVRRVCTPDRCDSGTCTDTAKAIRELHTGSDTQVEAAVNSALQDLAQCAEQ
jgi:hypothetical protein